MKFVHKSLSNLPIIIIIEWLICAFFLTNNKWYLQHFELLDDIDTYVVYFSLMHFMFFTNHYSLSKKIFVSTIMLSIMLRFISDYIHTEIYYYLYYAIILMPFIANAWMKLNVKKR